jgi:oligopeptide/dipeptide ABC transporter ATP-binding protein
MYKDRDIMKELLKLNSLKKYFKIKDGLLKAVDGISFSVAEAEVFGLVGESGCGKSTLARLILGLMEPTKGSIVFNGTEINIKRRKELVKMRKSLQIIFQDPLAALNPRKRVFDTIQEPLLINRIVRKKEAKDYIVHLLHKVGLGPDVLYRYPHEFSGGQRQRVCIARALAVNPRLIVADEPLSALDVSVQAQILNLMIDLKKDSELAYIFISHNLQVIEHFSDRVAVMYLGKIVEMANAEDLFKKPFHPYTEALLSSVPRPEFKEKESKRIILGGDVPSPVHLPSGCPFHPRCHRRFTPCDREIPVLREIEDGRVVSCHLWH